MRCLTQTPNKAHWCPWALPNGGKISWEGKAGFVGSSDTSHRERAYPGKAHPSKGGAGSPSFGKEAEPSGSLSWVWGRLACQPHPQHSL